MLYTASVNCSSAPELGLERFRVGYPEKINYINFLNEGMNECKQNNTVAGSFLLTAQTYNVFGRYVASV